MGQKEGKHARDAEGEEGEGSPSPKRSPKRSSRGSKVSKSSSQESTPPNPDLPTTTTPKQEPPPFKGEVSQPSLKHDPEKENPKKAKSKPSESPVKAKSAKKSPMHEAQQQEPMTVEQKVAPVQSPAPPLSQQSPAKMEPRELEPLTPLIITDGDISAAAHDPKATSTPAVNGRNQPASPPLSPGSTTDQSDDEAFVSAEQQSSLLSPDSSFVSVSTYGSIQRQHLCNGELPSRQSAPDFGRFYTTNYLELSSTGSLRKSSNSIERERSKSPHYHRPGSGMSALATGKRVVKVHRSSSPADTRSEEPIRLSMFPGAKPKAPNELAKIERDDWPAPASPAVILPEILRERRRSRGEADKDDDDDEEEVTTDPKIQREMEEISKIKDESGIGQIIFQELTELKQKPSKPMDPWKASRVPSAKYEPRYHTRYQSPMFASPSRFVDVKRHSWDDYNIRGYRSVSTLANLPTPKPGYGPSYSTTPRAATLPVNEMYGRRDLTYFGFRDDSHDSEGHQRSNYTSTSTLTDSLSRSRGGVPSVALYEVPCIPLLKLQKSSWHTECDPPVYDYEKLKITKFDLPRDVDRNRLEIHLNTEQFECLFKMPREKFYRLAEWKRNDMKKKVDLY
ncbi:uncharacterized protein LOC143293897 isoform X2 [Babylonia areolata]|uniref:uncharacterized protein LOC143293897 isoform X2 n=1 Tax=Babylonia areolata TaxID=304850 RepID=UPI003FD61720